MPDSEATMLSVIGEQISHIREDVKELREDLKSGTVPRSEWELRNKHVTERLNKVQDDFYSLRNQIETSKTPLATVLSIILAFGALAWSVFGPLV